MGCEDAVDTSIDPGGGGGGDGLDSKQKMMIKKGKVAVAAKSKVNKATSKIKQMRRR
jgi:hypothetical protein